MMYDGVSALGKVDDIAVRDIAELVAESMTRKPSAPAAIPAGPETAPDRA
jgi:hypothetical protein